MLQLQQSKSEIESLGLQVVIVTFETPARAAAYIAETALAWPLLIDQQRELYQRYSMGRGKFWDIWGTHNWPTYFKIMASGRMPRRPHGNVYQLGGDVLIDPEQIVRLHHVGSGPADRPEVDSLLTLVREAGVDA